MQTKSRLADAFSDLEASLAHWEPSNQLSTATALRLVSALNTQIGKAAAAYPGDRETMKALQKKVNAVTVAVKAARRDELMAALEEARRALGRFLEA